MYDAFTVAGYSTPYLQSGADGWCAEVELYWWVDGSNVGWRDG